ncbi:hypothetical protein LC2W_0617 [Lacticaseibacillus paracasei]|nr:hypothetical protein LC2W_0617 [Lacticaseibacillus paracasei]AEA56118.1 hypothetical protein LCBD_0620 [Lacticaseibacillus paracasei]EPC18268.1 hypothetical protein Lpp226_2182 [Lacticaseibacillus paracasei subsp. paracasei Lpp226]EPC35187.1 hypothetical protein Lpp223_0697 [Lacticaseibacillus paracasei subsp. paracasei Lpp223]
MHKACGVPPRGQARRNLSTAGFCLALILHSTSNKAAKEQVPKQL